MQSRRQIKPNMVVKVLLGIVALGILGLGMLFSEKKEESRDVGQYMQVDSYVEQQMSDYFPGLMPSAEKLPTDADYYYSYDAPAFGDPSFCVYLRCVYSAETYSSETDRLLAVCDKSVTVSSGVTAYIVQYPENADRYFDDMISDGTFFYFGVAYADEETSTITYLAAMETDARKSDLMYSYIEPLAR